MPRLPLVGRIHSLSLTADNLALTLQSKFHGVDINYRCHSRRPEILAIATDLQPGQLVGLIGSRPDIKVADEPTGFHIEHLEIIGRAAEVQP